MVDELEKEGWGGCSLTIMEKWDVFCMQSRNFEGQ